MTYSQFFVCLGLTAVLAMTMITSYSQKISQMRYRADESDSSMHSIEHVAYFYTAHQYDNQPMYHLFQTMNDNINHLTYVIALSLLIQNSLKEQDGFFHNIHPSAMYSMGSGTCSQLVKI